MPSWLTPYRKPSPTLVAGPVTEARFTLSDSAAEAFPAVPASVVPSASSTAAAAMSGLILFFIETPPPSGGAVAHAGRSR